MLGSELVDNRREGRTHRFPIFTHICHFPTFDPTGVSLEFTNSSRIIEEGKTRAQPRSVPTINKTRSWPAQLCRPIKFLVVTCGQPNESPNIICESSPDEALAEMIRNSRYDLRPRRVRTGEYRRLPGDGSLTSSMNMLS